MLPDHKCPAHARYQSDCSNCRSSRSRYERHRRKRKELGWTARVDSRATRRRLQALMRIGYGPAALAVELGISRSRIHVILESEKVSREMEQRVAGLYSRLENTPAYADRYTKAIATVSKAKGYAPPAAWDDIATDDAPSDPDEDALSMREQIVELRELRFADWQIAKRLGLQEQTVREFYKDARVA